PPGGDGGEAGLDEADGVGFRAVQDAGQEGAAEEAGKAGHEDGHRCPLRVWKKTPGSRAGDGWASNRVTPVRTCRPWGWVTSHGGRGGNGRNGPSSTVFAGSVSR